MPQWLKLSTAFFFPFFTTLAASWSVTDHVSAVIIALAAGFGGFAGFGTNQQIKAGYTRRAKEKYDR